MNQFLSHIGRKSKGFEYELSKFVYPLRKFIEAFLILTEGRAWVVEPKLRIGDHRSISLMNGRNLLNLYDITIALSIFTKCLHT